MTAKAAQIMAEALELPPPTRAFVAERLIESLEAGSGKWTKGRWRSVMLTPFSKRPLRP
jgi:hypothetical protein